MKVRATNEAVTSALEGPHRGFEQELNTDGSANLLFTRAKAYSCGGGWWNILGYAQDQRDRDNAIKRIVEG